MTIMLKKNGQLIIDPAPPLEGKDANLDNLAAFISDPQDGNAIVYNAAKGIWEAREVSGGSGGGMAVKVELSDAGMVIDHTWKEIHDALPLMPVTLFMEGEQSPGVVGCSQGSIVAIYSSAVEGGGTDYVVTGVMWVADESAFEALNFVTDSEDGYPTSQA